MPSIETTIDFSELLGYAEDSGIASWNEACDIIYCLYPSDSEGSTQIDPVDIEKGYYSKDQRLIDIVVGFAKKYEDEYKTYSRGFKAVVD